MDYDFIISEPENEYHSRSKSGEYMSSHLLQDFRKSPLLYRRKTTGVIPDVDSSAYAFGRAAHKLILEGREAFFADYIVGDGPVNERTGTPYGVKSKAYTDWLAAQDREVISTADCSTMLRMRDAATVHTTASLLLASPGPVEGVIRAELENVPCQIRMDKFLPDYNGKPTIVDLKTTADLWFFEYELRRFGYLYQMAFYREVFAAASGGVRPEVYMIALEKQEPYNCGVWYLAENALDEATMTNAATLRNANACRLSEVYPTGYEDLRTIYTL